MILKIERYFFINWKEDSKCFLVAEVNEFQSASKAFSFDFVVLIFKQEFADQFLEWNLFVAVENNFESAGYFH